MQHQAPEAISEKSIFADILYKGCEDMYTQSVPAIISKNVGNTLTNYKTWNGVIYNVVDYKAKGNGVSDDTSAIVNAINAATEKGGGIIFFPAGTYRISTNFTSPNTSTLWFANGAKLSIDIGKTVSINGPIEAGLYQIFAGSGTVVGKLKVDEVYPQWWGAKGDGAHDDSAAINAAITCSQTAGAYNGSIVLFPPGHYVISETIVVPHGTESKRVTLSGYNATLRAATSGMDVIQVASQGSPSSFMNIGETRIFGFRIECSGIANRAIVIGRNGSTYPYGVDGVFKSLIRDVDIRDFLTVGIEIADSRLWSIDDCTISTTIPGANCVYLNSTNDINMADHWFSKTQMSVTGGNTANVCVKMRVSAITGSSGLGGIHFTDCVFYGQAINCQATSANSGFRDIFFTSCAVDGLNTNPGFYGFYFKSVPVGSGAVHMINTWVNAQSIGVYMENVDGSQVSGGKISSCSYHAIQINSTAQCSVEGIKIYDVNFLDNGGGVINLSGAGNRNKVIGNNIYNAAGHSTVIILVGSGQVKPIVTLNTTDAGTCVSNNVVGTEGTDFIVSGNLNG